MAMKKSIGRTLAHIDVAANTSVRIHEDFFNTHRDYHQLSGDMSYSAKEAKCREPRSETHSYMLQQLPLLLRRRCIYEGA
jgi:hypothetical protein